MLLFIRSLNSNNLRGSIPGSLGNLSELTWLDITDNELSQMLQHTQAHGPAVVVTTSRTLVTLSAASSDEPT